MRRHSLTTSRIALPLMTKPAYRRRSSDATIKRVARMSWNHNVHYHDFVLGEVPQRCHLALDVGCGRGELTRKLATLSDEVIGIDTDHGCLAARLSDFVTCFSQEAFSSSWAFTRPPLQLTTLTRLRPCRSVWRFAFCGARTTLERHCGTLLRRSRPSDYRALNYCQVRFCIDGYSSVTALCGADPSALKNLATAQGREKHANFRIVGHPSTTFC